MSDSGIIRQKETRRDSPGDLTIDGVIQMKLAEALILRADLQNRLEQLRERLTMNALVQEGEEPAEKPADLLAELDSMSGKLESLIAAINLTNAATMVEGKTITELLARREVLTQRISLMRSLLDAANRTVMRGSRNEVKVRSTVPVADLRRQTDKQAEALRKLDTSIQAANWTTDLKE